MTIDIKTLSEKDLEAKIEQTAEALKLYEAELKVRQLPVPLGVPSKGMWYTSGFGYVDMDDTSFTVDHYNDTLNSFPSKESAKKHGELTFVWRKGLVAAAKGEPIDIEVLKPFLKKGWVAMDEDGEWYWFVDKPVLKIDCWMQDCCLGELKGLTPFNIKPAADWKTSLQECGL